MANNPTLGRQDLWVVNEDHVHVYERRASKVNPASRERRELGGARRLFDYSTIRLTHRLSHPSLTGQSQTKNSRHFCLLIYRIFATRIHPSNTHSSPSCHSHQYYLPYPLYHTISINPIPCLIVSEKPVSESQSEMLTQR